MTREVLKQSISFQLNPDSGVPAYLQLVQQVKQALRMGILDIGDKLPTVKEVVAEVAVNPNTVMKAYWQLEHEGLVEGRQGVGTFAVRRPAGPPPAMQLRLARSLEAGCRQRAMRGSTTKASNPCCARRCPARGLRKPHERAERAG